jgi:MFS family permease
MSRSTELGTEDGLRPKTLVALLVAMFMVAVGYGFVLPVLPFLVEHLAATTDETIISRHTGLLTGVYMTALFLFPPFWGRLSDRWGRRRVIVIGLVGFGSSLAAFTIFESLHLLYLGRFLDGLFASGVTPAAQALVGERAPSEEWRARRLAWLAMAAVAGFLVGPVLGGLVVRAAEGMGIENIYDMPFLATASLAYVAALVAAVLVPRAAHEVAPTETGTEAAGNAGARLQLAVLPRLLTISLTVAAGLGAFEVTLALRGSRILDMTPFQIGLMFVECSLVMFVAQAIVFSPLVKLEATRRLIAPAMVLMAGALVAMPWTESFALLLVLVGIVAAAVGILYPIATYWVSRAAGKAQGRQLGRHAAAVSFGQAVGSAGGGLLFRVSDLPEATVVVAVALLVVLVATRTLPRLLAQLGSTGEEPRRFPIEATNVEKGRDPHAPL